MTRIEAIAFELLFGTEASVMQDENDLEKFGIYLTDSHTRWTVREALEDLVDGLDGDVKWSPK
jgi:6-phosphogluconate dehydrogenase (decarboxylating)